MKVAACCITLALCTAHSLHAATDFLDAVLSSHRLDDLQAKASLPATDTFEFSCGTPMRIFAEIVKNPSNDRAWAAAYHYRTMTDAGVSLAFNWACFDTLVENPTLFRDRYITGDNRSSELMRCAMWSDGSTRWGNLYGAVTKHGFADLASYYKWLFGTLDKKGTERETDNERGRRKDFIERAQRDLAEAEREMNSHLPK
jgi:hypothetical protein